MLELRNKFTHIIQRQIVIEGLHYIQKPSYLRVSLEQNKYDICFNSYGYPTCGQEYGVSFIVILSIFHQIYGSRQNFGVSVYALCVSLSFSI
jgi:hypothetical protein